MDLGLTISYAIVVDEHHGQLRVDSQEGESTEFTILIPRTCPPWGTRSCRQLTGRRPYIP